MAHKKNADNGDTLAPHRFKKGESRTRESGRNGGIKSGEARREKRTLRQIAVALRDLPAPKAARDVGGVKCDTYGEAVVAAMFAGAAGGDTHAYRALLETLGEAALQALPEIVAPVILGTIPQAEVDKAMAEHNARQEESDREAAEHGV